MFRMLILVLLCCVMITPVLADPPPNNDCANADDAGTLVEGYPVQLTGTTVEATVDCSSFWDPEVWIKFTLSSCMDVTIDYCDYEGDFYGAESKLFDDCPCDAGDVYNGNWLQCPNMNPSLTWSNLGAGTYYFPVMGYNGGSPYTINIAGVSCPPPPDNDDCSGAIAIGEVTSSAFTIRSATYDGSGSCITEGGNVWFLYTSSFTGFARIDLTGSEFESIIAVYDGASCSPLPSQLGCSQSLHLDFPVTSGQSYLVEIGSNYVGTGNGYLTIAEAPNTPPNDDCANADDAGTLVEGYPVQLTGTTVEATQDCGYFWYPEVWVKFTLSSCMDVTIDYCDNEYEVYDAPTQLFEACPCDVGNVMYGNQQYCNNMNPSISWSNLEAGTYYYPVLGFDGGRSYTINIEGVSCPPPPDNDNCSDAIAVGEVASSPFSVRSATYDGSGSCITEGGNVWFLYTSSFTGFARIDLMGSEFESIIAAYDGNSCSPLPSQLGCNQGSFLDFPVTSGQSYLVEIGSNYIGTGNGYLTIAEAPNTPPNDDCANADDAGTLTSDETVQLTGTTVEATRDCDSHGYPEVWVKFTLESCMNVTIDFCENQYYVYQTSSLLFTDCPCSGEIFTPVEYGCEFGQYTYRTWNGLNAGTYYYPIFGHFEYGGNPYIVNITGVDCPPPPEPDFVVTAPYTGTSSTCGAGNNCYLTYPGEDHIYEITVPTDGDWVFSFCNSESFWEFIAYIGTSICESDVSVSTYDCENGHKELIAYDLESGTYYLTIDCLYEGCGEYTLDIYELPPPCEGAYYTNGDSDNEDGIAIYRGPEDEGVYFACDDFTIAEDITLETIKFICAFADDEETYFDREGDFQILANDNGAPGSVLFNRESSDCSRISLNYTYNENDEVYAYKFDNLDIELAAGTYFLACRTVSSPTYWLTTDSQTGSTAYFKDNTNTSWTVYEGNSDLAFCLFAAGGDTYEYLPGDANMAAGAWPPNVIGADVTYLVNYFRAIAAPCLVGGFYNSADANGDCSVIGADVTYLVQYFRGANELHFCPDYEPTWQSSGDLPAEAPDGWPNCE